MKLQIYVRKLATLLSHPLTILAAILAVTAVKRSIMALDDIPDEIDDPLWM